MAGLHRVGLLVVAVLGLSFAPWPVGVPGGGTAGVARAAPEADAGSTQVVIDAPKGGTTSTQIEVRGWAADPNARGGTGVDRVEVYLDGERDAGGTRLGQATYGLQRPDVAANLGGQQFLLSGFALQTTIAAGPHTVYVYAHSSDQAANDGWATPKQTTLMAVPGAPPAGTALVATPPVVVAGAPGGAVTIRSPNATGSVTLDVPGGGAYYPPGPADAGGAIYAPPYFGYGLYGGDLAYPGYAPYYGLGVVVPPWFDFSLGTGADLYGVGALYPDYGYPWGGYYPYASIPRFPNSFRDYVLPAWGRASWASGPVYCPLYTAVVC